MVPVPIFKISSQNGCLYLWGAYIHVVLKTNVILYWRILVRTGVWEQISCDKVLT